MTGRCVLTFLLTFLSPLHKYGVLSKAQVSPDIVLAALPAVAVARAVLSIVTSLEVGIVVVVVAWHN